MPFTKIWPLFQECVAFHRSRAKICSCDIYFPRTGLVFLSLEVEDLKKNAFDDTSALWNLTI